MAGQPLESLGALLAKVGLPWYEAIIVEEAGVPDSAALLQLHAAGTLLDTLAEAGVEKHHGEAIAAELDKLQASLSRSAAGGSTASSAAAAAAASAPPSLAAPDDGSQAHPPTFTAGGIYSHRFLSVRAHFSLTKQTVLLFACSVQLRPNDISTRAHLSPLRSSCRSSTCTWAPRTSPRCSTASSAS